MLPFFFIWAHIHRLTHKNTEKKKEKQNEENGRISISKEYILLVEHKMKWAKDMENPNQIHSKCDCKICTSATGSNENKFSNET